MKCKFTKSLLAGIFAPVFSSSYLWQVMQRWYDITKRYMWLRYWLKSCTHLWDFLSRVSSWFLLEIYQIFKDWPLLRGQSSPIAWCGKPRNYPYFTSIIYPFHMSESCVTAEKTEFICAQFTSAETSLSFFMYKVRFLREIQVPPRADILSIRACSVHFLGLCLALALLVWPLHCSGPRQGLALCSLSWEVSWLHSGWMLEPQQQELIPWKPGVRL